MSRSVFHHEAMATTFSIVVAGADADYARQATAAAFRELDGLENELSRYIESSDIGRSNRLRCGESTTIGDDALQCLLISAEVSEATARRFDVAYASVAAAGASPGAPLFSLDPATHTLTSHAERLHLDLGAVGKGYALDRLAGSLRDWEVTGALLDSGGSTVLAVGRPEDASGWEVGMGEGPARHALMLRDAALSGSGTAVKGAHLVDPRSGAPAARRDRVWAWAETGAVADALSTALFVMTDAEVAEFAQLHPEIGAAITMTDGTVRRFGRLDDVTPGI